MTFTLKTENCRAECTTVGGELISFVCDGHEYVWNSDPEFWSGCAPHLFPTLCSSLNGKVAYDGVEYEMPKHGIVKGKDFKLVELAPDFAVFEYKWNEETLKHYPYKFTLKVTHALGENCFTTRYTVTGEEDMIFNIGGHPAFFCPMNDGEEFEDYELRFRNAEGSVMSLTTDGYMNGERPKLHRIKDNVLPLKYSDFDEDAMILENLPSHKVELVSSCTGRGIKFNFKGFDALGIWTPMDKKSPFLCLEPWCGLPADVTESGKAEDKKYAKTLKAGETFTVAYSVSVI